MVRPRRLGWSLAGAAALVASPLVAWAGLGSPASSLREVAAPAVIDPALAPALAAGTDEQLVVFVHGTTTDAATRAVADAGLTRLASWDRIGVVVAAGTAAQVAAVTDAPGVTYVERDEALAFSMETSHQATRYDEVLATTYTVDRTDPSTTPGNANGRGKGTVRKPERPGATVTEALPPLDGSGVSIAVIDSGIDATHPLFNRDGESKVVRNMKLVTAPCAVVIYIDTPAPCTGPRETGGGADKLPAAWVELDDTDTPSNGGHGTHVAGIAAAYPSETRELHGSAPGARLVGLSVGQVISVFGGNQGLNWVLENHAAPCGPDVPASVCPPIKVVNNSYGPTGGGEFAEDDATTKLQRALVDAGVVVVWANGNDGGDGSSNLSNPPAQDPTPGILGVANYDDEDTGTRDGQLASSSSRGDREVPATYPDLSAPGSSIMSACRITLPICTSGETDPDYGVIGGTSMAAPHVAGYTAVLQQASMASKGRWLTPAEIEDLLEDTAYKFTAGAPYVADLPERNGDDTTSFDKGHGLVDVKAAVATLLGSPLGEVDPTPPPGAACEPGAPLVSDPEGDATSAVLVGVAPNEPTLDIRSGNITDDGEDLVFSIEVAALEEANPSTAPQISFNSYFTYGDLEWYVDAGRSATGLESFSFGLAQTVDAAVTTAAVRAPLAQITGAFDATTDTITMVLPKEVLSGESGEPVASGAVIGGIQLHSRRAYTTTPITQGAAADDAIGTCPFVVPGEPVAPAPPAPAGEPEGSVTPGTTYRWESEPRTEADLVAACAVGVNRCDDRLIQVNVPAGGGLIDVAIDGVESSGLDDFDLYVLDPFGEEIASSATASPDEAVSGIAVTVPGVYTVRVVHFVAVEATYVGTFTLR